MIQRLVIVIIIVAAIAAAMTILRAVQVAREPLVWRSGALARSMWLWGAATCTLVAAAWVIGIRRGELHMVGKPIQLYRNVRQKSMRKIVDVDPVCVKTEQIIVAVETDRRSRVLIERPLAGHWEDLSPADVLALAKADGFTTAADFYAFFVPVPGDHFRGHIIHWDWT